MSKMAYPKLGEHVTGRCICCGRVPRNSETYGPHREGWDLTGTCPKCWETEITAVETEAADEIAVDGALYEEMTGKTLGDK